MKLNVHEVQVWRSPLHVASESCAENSEGGAVCVCGGGGPSSTYDGSVIYTEVLVA